MLVIDLSERKLLKETWMEMLGSWSKSLLKMMYGDDVQVIANVNEEEGAGPKFIIRGKHKDVKSYAQAIVAEKNYLDAYSRYGKKHLQTVKAREELDTAVGNFESTTGLLWPFKDEG
jgi:hypothetical protein|tara:strand:- start:131 stop:481 length:351 start_codon:yes stop_codon:yes gene_type:complete